MLDKELIEEAIGMRCTDFIFEFIVEPDVIDTILVYIKEFDPNRGFSCWSHGFVSDAGNTFNPINEDEEREEACCMIGMDFVKHPEFLDIALKMITDIKLNGRLAPYEDENSDGIFNGCPLK